MDELMTKAKLITSIKDGREQLDKTLAPVPEAQMLKPGDNGWSLKDLLAHFTFWQRRAMNRHLKNSRGEPLENEGLPGEDFQTGIDRINADIFERNRNRLLADIRTEFDQSFQQLLATVESLPESYLLSPYGKSATYMVWQNIADNTYAHYQEHDPMIQARLHI